MNWTGRFGELDINIYFFNIYIDTINIIIDIVDTINIIAIYKYLSSLEYSIFIKALNIYAYFGGF